MRTQLINQIKVECIQIIFASFYSQVKHIKWFCLCKTDWADTKERGLRFYAEVFLLFNFLHLNWMSPFIILNNFVRVVSGALIEETL